MTNSHLGSQQIYPPKVKESVVLVRQINSQDRQNQPDLEEIRLLAESAGAQVVGSVVSKRTKPRSSTFIGTGKVEELHQVVVETNASLVIVDHTISPVQERNLEKQVQCRVIDRTRLILDIFANRASSSEGKLQVELAQLNHLSTRLVRGWTHLERQKGGIGLRGPGETQLETDRRLIGRRIKVLTRRLEKIRTQRELRRNSRQKVPISTVALVGYTNAGKSSLFNRLSGANVVSANQLFSTLDTTMRRLELPDYGSIIVSDTVGFIRELPHGLVSAFHATLEEVSRASILLHVVDVSCDHIEDRVRDVERVLKEIDADRVPRILVYNKIDRMDIPAGVRRSANGNIRRIWVSALTGEGLKELVNELSDFFRRDYVFGRICLQNDAGKLRATVYQRLGVISEQITENGDTVLDLEMSPNEVNWLNSFQDFKSKYWHVRPSVDL